MDNAYYIKKFHNPTEHYKRFLYHYVQSTAKIAGRGEEDISIWEKLQGEELEAAKSYILASLREEPHVYTIRATTIFKDPLAIPLLEEIIHNSPDRFIIEKLYAARVLYDWTGYKDYIGLLQEISSNCSASTANYIYYSKEYFLKDIPLEERNYILSLLNPNKSD